MVELVNPVLHSRPGWPSRKGIHESVLLRAHHKVRLKPRVFHSLKSPCFKAVRRVGVFGIQITLVKPSALKVGEGPGLVLFLRLLNLNLFLEVESCLYHHWSLVVEAAVLLSDFLAGGTD